MCMCVDTCRDQKRALDPTGTGVVGDFKNGCWEPNSGHLQVQYVSAIPIVIFIWRHTSLEFIFGITGLPALLCSLSGECPSKEGVLTVFFPGKHFSWGLRRSSDGVSAQGM